MVAKHAFHTESLPRVSSRRDAVPDIGFSDVMEVNPSFRNLKLSSFQFSKSMVMAEAVDIRPANTATAESVAWSNLI
ncbi:MAG TPA: hypothetical protein DET40_12890 [Lentisphaeria bacterium]|nr:MAG: hypothetical protein A2X45_13815 [Lentisphaerae bacterium GWF2_50_93]HCE44437.1 hypothetical protein [Lentisphaeria bacterium]